MPENPMRGRQLHDHLVRSTGPCSERDGRDQGTPAGMRPAQMCCTRCSRMTARRDERGMPWCGGEPVTVEQRTAEIFPGRWCDEYGPLLPPAGSP